MEQATDLRAQPDAVAVLLLAAHMNRELDGGVTPMRNVKEIETLAFGHPAQIDVQSILLHGPQHAAVTQELVEIRIGERAGLL